MDDANLIRMANRIGDFFAGMSDEAEAREGVAQHIRRYWAPLMRRQVYAAIDAGAEGMQPLVAAALEEHRRQLEPAPQADRASG